MYGTVPACNEERKMSTIQQATQEMRDAGYSEQEIAKGAAYAEKIGHRDDGDRFFSLAMARILYSTDQLEQCESAGTWYPVDAGCMDDVVVR